MYKAHPLLAFVAANKEFLRKTLPFCSGQKSTSSMIAYETAILCLFIFLIFNFNFNFFWVFLGLYQQHMEVPRLGVKSELQLLTYATATATQDLSHIYDPHHSSWQRQILNPLTEAKDRTHVLTDASRVHYRRATVGTPILCILKGFPLKESMRKSLSFSLFYRKIFNKFHTSKFKLGFLNVNLRAHFLEATFAVTASTPKCSKSLCNFS